MSSLSLSSYLCFTLSTYLIDGNESYALLDKAFKYNPHVRSLNETNITPWILFLRHEAKALQITTFTDKPHRQPSEFNKESISDLSSTAAASLPYTISTVVITSGTMTAQEIILKVKNYFETTCSVDHDSSGLRAHHPSIKDYEDLDKYIEER